MVNLRSIPSILLRAGVVDSQSLAKWEMQINDEIIRRRSTSIGACSSNTRKRSHGDVFDGNSADMSSDIMSSNKSANDPDAATPHHQQRLQDSQFDAPDMSESKSESFMSLGSFDDVADDHGAHTSTASRIGIVWPTESTGAIVPAQPKLDFANLHKLEPEQHRALLESLDKPDLVAYSMRQHSMVANHAQTIQSLRRELKTEKQRTRRAVHSLNAHKEKILTLKNPEVTDLQVFRGKAKKLSWRGSISLGLRKSIAFVSASSFPMSSLLDIGRQTVTRCEVLVGAYIMMRSVFFHRVLLLILKRLASVQSGEHHPEFQQAQPAENLGTDIVLHGRSGLSSIDVASHNDAICKDFGLPLVDAPISTSAPMLASGDSTDFCIGCTFFSGDATNSAIWRRQKLQGLMVTSGVMLDWDALCQTNYRKAFRSLSWVSFGPFCCTIFFPGLDLMNCFTIGPLKTTNQI